MQDFLEYLVPVSLKKFNIDPAIASSVFVTTITDVIGFLSFLGLGAYFFYTVKYYQLILPHFQHNKQ